MNNDSSVKHLLHDLNNIFTRILNSVDLIKRKTENAESVLPLLNNIETGTFLAAEMIEETFGIKSSIAKVRNTNLNAIINDIILSSQLQTKYKIEFNVSLEPQLNFIKGKYTDYYRLILNLISNSIEAIEKDGRIDVSTKNLSNQNKVEIIVKDNGTGIDKNNIPFIFSENFSTRNKKNISGFGLSIVKEIVEKYAGEITVNSKIGEGTEFKITFPATIVTEEPNLKSGKTILIAEDENILCDLVSGLLESYGYIVITVANGKEVLENLKLQTPDLLLIDQIMPELTGLECINKIQKEGFSIPIIFTSGSHAELEEAASTNTITKTLIKPYNFEELLKLVKELIG